MRGEGWGDGTMLSRPPKVRFSTWRSSARVCSVDLVRVKVRARGEGWGGGEGWGCA